MRKNIMELSRTLRLQTLYLLLSGKDLHTLAMEQKVTVKAIKHRLTLLYKFYKVKNRIELMSLYVNIPLDIRKSMKENNAPIKRRTKYKTLEQFGPLSKDSIILPIGLDTKKQN